MPKDGSGGTPVKVPKVTSPPDLPPFFIFVTHSDENPPFHVCPRPVHSLKRHCHTKHSVDLCVEPCVNHKKQLVSFPSAYSTAAPGAISQVAGGQHVPRSYLICVAACCQQGAQVFDPRRFDPPCPAFSDNVELILQGIGSRHNSEGQDNDQPDYDSVASDEDPVQEATCRDSGNDGRTKVPSDALNLSGPVYMNTVFL